MFLKDENTQRLSILLGTWNPEKHIEWINANPKKRSTGNAKERQYKFHKSLLSIIHFEII